MDLVPRELFPKRVSVISPSLMKPQWGDPLKFQFNPAFDLGFPEFTDPDYEHYAADKLCCWTESHFGNNLLKPERPPSKQFKHCVYAEQATSAASTWKDVTNRKQFGPITTRERESCMCCDPVQ